MPVILPNAIVWVTHLWLAGRCAIHRVRPNLYDTVIILLNIIAQILQDNCDLKLSFIDILCNEFQ